VELEEKTGGARERCRRWTRKGAASEPVTLDFILGVSRNLSDGFFFLRGGCGKEGSFWFVCFLAILEFELWVFRLLCHLSHTPSPFCFCYFSNMVSHLCPDYRLTYRDPPIYFSQIAGVAGTHHHAHISLVEMGSHEPFAQAGLPSALCLPSS
jgi:hypothetical protein